MMHPEGRGMASGSVKQRINTGSLMEAELLGCNDSFRKMIWVKNFIEGQRIPSKQNFLGRDNKSAMILAKKGKTYFGKCSRAMNIRYSCIKDHIDKGELSIHYCPSEKIVADFFMKPLQGEKFQKFHSLIIYVKIRSL